MIKNSSTLPAKLRRAPGRLKEIINGLIDFCRLNRISVGYGLKVEETNNGKVISVVKTLEDLIKSDETQDPNADNWLDVTICVDGIEKTAKIKGFIVE
jgi:hypothetical protein